MSLLTTRYPSATKWLFTGDNHIISFYENDEALTSNYAEITIPGVSNPIVIYPNPEGVFWFNFKEYFSAIINDIDDNVDPTGLDETDINTFVFDWSKIVLKLAIDYRVFYTNDTDLGTTINVHLVKGTETLMEYKKGETKNEHKSHILSPLAVGSANTHYMRYWEGYPFDVGFTSEIPNVVSPQKWKNLTNGIETPEFTVSDLASRIFLSNGDTSQTIEDDLPLTNGYNNILIEQNGGADHYLNIIKMVDSCGVYLKWFNGKGGYSYWLFNEQHSRVMTTKGLGMINADFEDNENTVSPERSLGRESQTAWNLGVDELTKDDWNYLKTLFESQKVLLFTGTPYAKNNFNDFVEVELSGTALEERDYKGRVPNVRFTIKLPQTKTVLL